METSRQAPHFSDSQLFIYIAFYRDLFVDKGVATVSATGL